MGAYSPTESARFLLLLFLGADTAPRLHLWFIPLPAGGGTFAFSMVANHTTKYYKLTINTIKKETDENHTTKLNKLTQAYYNKEQNN